MTAVYAAVGQPLRRVRDRLGVLIFTGYRALTGEMNWAGNWPLWGVVRWSDLGFFETDRTRAAPESRHGARVRRACSR